MSIESSYATVLRWHQALAFALLGERLPELGEQLEPDPDALAADLTRRPDFAESIAAARRSSTWPVPVPADLMAGLGWAQFAAVLRTLVEQLELNNPPAAAPRTGTGRPTHDDRRLLDEVPPHHLG